MDKFGIHLSYQSLIFNGKKLEIENAYMQDYGIQENSIVFLSVPQGQTSRVQQIQNLIKNSQCSLRSLLNSGSLSNH
jgi:hypothetical protein